jgi:RimJ/RimL family protein N-acetyltransferase
MTQLKTSKFNMKEILTQRLILNPFSMSDFDIFVSDILTDSRVVEFYYSYKKMSNIDRIYDKAKKEFWEHFEKSRIDYDLEVWAARNISNKKEFVGWCGLLHTELSLKYGGPELQYMIAGNAHGNGYATELASAVLAYATKGKLKSVIATVDIPNIGSIKVLEKIGFEHLEKIEAYGSTDMYLYQKNL